MTTLNREKLLELAKEAGMDEFAGELIASPENLERFAALLSAQVEPTTIQRKAYICKGCGFVYADDPVTQCDCMPEIQEWIEGVIIAPSRPDPMQELADQAQELDMGYGTIPSHELQTWPKRIFLLGSEGVLKPYPGISEDMGWCEDSINCGDVKYIRADLAIQSAGALLNRSAAQLRAWHEKYGEFQPNWLPPAGDVRLLEDIAEEIAKCYPQCAGLKPSCKPDCPCYRDAMSLLTEPQQSTEPISSATESSDRAPPALRDSYVWQPIETAPKDGTEILGWVEDAGRVICQWGKHNHVPIYGWIRRIELYGEEVDGFDPTHWMPLPDGPSQPASNPSEVAAATGKDAVELSGAPVSGDSRDAAQRSTECWECEKFHDEHKTEVVCASCRAAMQTKEQG